MPEASGGNGHPWLEVGACFGKKYSKGCGSASSVVKPGLDRRCRERRGNRRFLLAGRSSRLRFVGRRLGCQYIVWRIGVFLPRAGVVAWRRVCFTMARSAYQCRSGNSALHDYCSSRPGGDNYLIVHCLMTGWIERDDIRRSKGFAHDQYMGPVYHGDIRNRRIADRHGPHGFAEGEHLRVIERNKDFVRMCAGS